MMQTTQNKVAGIRIVALGVLLAALMAAFVLLAAKPSYASTTFTVNSTGDKNDLDFPGGVFDGSSGGKCFTGDVLVVQGEECTLRAAIQEANKTAGADVIEFDIPGTGVATIAPASQLPTVTGPVTINGYSQPGAQPNTKAIGSDAALKIELSGAEAMNANGLVIGASGSTVRGLAINNWQYAGVRIDGSGATGNRIAGNFIGTDVSGTNALANADGVHVYGGSDNLIGGTTAAARNVISGNGYGIVFGFASNGTTVAGNYIGTDATGTKDLGNSEYGVAAEGGSNSLIGGTTAAARNVISGNDLGGVGFASHGTRVSGNFIGTDASGTKDLGNGGNGVWLGGGTNNIIGGTTAGERNVISGNDGNGVQIEGANTTGNKVIGNYVGTDKNGTAPLGNAYDGVFIDGAPENVIGGATAGARNVISANKQAGINLYIAAAGNRVAGNYVGTDASGTKRLGNSEDGVRVYNASNNTIGGATAGERNIISANDGYGVLVHGPNAKGNKLTGNFIGTDKNGAPLGNSAGVFISFSSNNTVGGTTAGERNVIANNGGTGVGLGGDTATGNRVLQNSIYANGGLGIDLGDDGPTANDPADAATGPNNLQNKPLLSSAKTGSLKTNIRGTLNSSPNRTFAVRLFSNPSGGDEGKVYIGTVSVTTDGSGNGSFSFSTESKVALGRTVTATATDPGGNTSEFSAPKSVVAP